MLLTIKYTGITFVVALILSTMFVFACVNWTVYAKESWEHRNEH